MSEGETRLISLEAGDEFEDFATDDWPTAKAETDGADSNLWEEQWEDDDNLDDDFAETLKAELAKQSQTSS